MCMRWADRQCCTPLLRRLTDIDLELLGIKQSTQQYALNLAKLCEQAGLEGVVCSGEEAPLMRQNFDAKFKLVTPGIRPDFTAQNDQKRVMTPRAALDAGSNYLVIGRPITQAPDPESALQQILNQLTD
jgi:orotidine-5'-phosphate decarboxylase